MRGNNQRGSSALVLSLVLIAGLGGLSVGIHKHLKSSNQVKMTQLSKTESFYAGELSAIYGALKEESTPIEVGATKQMPIYNSPDGGIYAFLENNAKDTKKTREFFATNPQYLAYKDGLSNLIRRFDSENLTYTYRGVNTSDNSKTFCGGLKTPSGAGPWGEKFEACVKKQPPPPPPPPPKCAFIDFESVPSSTPSMGKEISDQYKALYGVSFKLLPDSSNGKFEGDYPVLARVNYGKNEIPGNPRAWQCRRCVGDNTNKVGNAATAEIVQNWVLTQADATKAKGPAALIVEYTNPVDEASGHLIDLDAGETWTVTALDINGQPFTDGVATSTWTLTAPKKQGLDTFNGISMKWTVKRPSKDIYSLKIEGNKNARFFGFAFDQFSPSCIQ